MAADNQKIRCQDHLGNWFESQADMARAYGISEATLSYRLNHNYSLERALTLPIRGYTICEDGFGNTFKSAKDMLNYHGLRAKDFYAKVKSGKSYNAAILEIKDEASSRKNRENISELARINGVRRCTLQKLVDNGMDIDLAIQTCKPRGIYSVGMEVFGINYDSLAKVAEEFNIETSKFHFRIKKSRWDIEVALVSTDKVSLKFLGLDNRAYYYVPWGNKIANARQIIEHYRPDLLEAYDKSNPTGEYRPYKRG